ncbi:MAG TPA: hypothetical protein VFQ35_10130 [Polyangiaceae bacterium]|nr:hypothetical protein [Polyangiaceae bacterium]
MLAVACGTPPKSRSPEPELSDVAPLSDFEPTRYRSGAPVASPIEPAVSTATAVACRFEVPMWSGPLQITRANEPFATVADAHDVRIAVFETDVERGASVELDVLGVTLEALVPLSELELYTTRARLFDGFVWALPGASLRLERASAGRVAAKLRLPAAIEPASPSSPRELACAELGAAPANDSGQLPRELFGSRRVVQSAPFRGDRRVPLSSKPSGEPIAFLDTRPSDPESLPDEAIVLERRRDQVRIAYLMDALIVFGWVPAHALQAELVETPIELVQGLAPWGRPVEPFGGDDPTRVELPGEPRTCAWNAPLAIEVAGAVRTVGTLASAIPLLPLATRDGWREVEFSHPALSFSKRARAWVPERRLYPCTPRH